MANYVMVAAGQCGNQLCYELMNQIDQHLAPDMYQHNDAGPSTSSSSAKNKKSPAHKMPPASYAPTTEPSEDQQLLYEAFFRQHTSVQAGTKSLARIVSLDTEPKVIDDCVVRRKQAAGALSSSSPNSKKQKAAALTSSAAEAFYPPWQYDTKSIAFRHGGAGNNWSLGYSLAQGDFLDTILNCIRRQLELADTTPHLVFCHSLAGGTGSGLGTRVTECAVEEFPECLTTNIVVAPYHFGEVVVQHYNALLCLSKIQACSQSVILLENQMAQVLCQQMRGIERPTLSDLNCVLANHITPLFLPKVTSRSPFATIRQHFSDDIIFLASHPAYRFLNIKLTPQTSKQSVDFTFDQWPALFKTIQRMQLSGAYSERNIVSHIKRLGLIPGTSLASIHEADDMSQHTMASYASPIGHVRSRSGPGPVTAANTTSASMAHWNVSSPSQEALKQGGMIRSLASVISCHGESASSYVSDSFLSQMEQQQQRQKGRLPVEVLLYSSGSSSSSIGGHGPGHGGGRPSLSRSGSRHTHMEEDYRHLGHISTTTTTAVGTPVSPPSVRQSTSSSLPTHDATTSAATALPLFDEYIAAHHSLVAQSGIDTPIHCHHSRFLLHGYQRSAHVMANDQSMLPILRRATMKSEHMFRTGAYVHQYAMYGVDTADFVQAFYDIGSVIQNYEQL